MLLRSCYAQSSVQITVSRFLTNFTTWPIKINFDWTHLLHICYGVIKCKVTFSVDGHSHLSTYLYTAVVHMQILNVHIYTGINNVHLSKICLSVLCTLTHQNSILSDLFTMCICMYTFTGSILACALHFETWWRDVLYASKERTDVYTHIHMYVCIDVVSELVTV